MTHQAGLIRKLNVCRWAVAVPSTITSHLQVLLTEDKTGRELACIEGPGLFRLSNTEEYRIVINGTQQDLNDLLWVRIVIASGLVAAKQQRRRWGRTDSTSVNDRPTSGEVMFEE